LSKFIRVRAQDRWLGRGPVEAGQPVIGSMKMEKIPVLSHDAGTVREVLVAENELVEQGQVVAILEDLAGA
jgi:biotin carboxyl carrier protein